LSPFGRCRQKKIDQIQHNQEGIRREQQRQDFLSKELSSLREDLEALKRQVAQHGCDLSA
jgi:hypothetical protein